MSCFSYCLNIYLSIMIWKKHKYSFSFLNTWVVKNFQLLRARESSTCWGQGGLEFNSVRSEFQLVCLTIQLTVYFSHKNYGIMGLFWFAFKYMKSASLIVSLMKSFIKAVLIFNVLYGLKICTLFLVTYLICTMR